ncbi:glycosyltransferase [Merdimonas faecis]|uniref:glycosyltransferase n=1 Tax=Merdimonas faecis TaxID=1653435 RepID=UPI0023F76ED3|nr:glycosyltransferase [Merdimonas faecis]
MSYFSIIIPVYQTEKYIEECIESVLKQELDDYELILVDDGSTDESPAICDQYASKFEKICVIHKRNGGLSDARNAGISAAEGKYLLFLDSDDFWSDSKFLKKLKIKIEHQNCDVMNFHYKYFYEEENQYRDFFFNIDEESLWRMNADQRFQYLVEQNQYIASACNKAVSRELILKNSLYFRVGITSEDIEWCARLASCSEKMGGCNLDAYCYRQREESITHTVKAENVDMLRKNIRACIKYGKLPDRSREYKEAYFIYTAFQYGTLLFHINHLEKKARNEQRKLAKPYRYLLKYGNNMKIVLLRAFNRLVGYRGMNHCLRFFIILSAIGNRKKGKQNG